MRTWRRFRRWGTAATNRAAMFAQSPIFRVPSGLQLRVRAQPIGAKAQHLAVDPRRAERRYDSWRPQHLDHKNRRVTDIKRYRCAVVNQA